MADVNNQPQEAENLENQTCEESNADSEVNKEASKDARMWALFCHLAGLAGYVMPIVGNIVAPLIFWQIKKDEYPFVDEQGKEAVNFQISMSLYTLIGVAVCIITCIGIVLAPFVGIAVGLVDLVFLLIAAVSANNGKHYRYPLTIRFIK